MKKRNLSILISFLIIVAISIVIILFQNKPKLYNNQNVTVINKSDVIFEANNKQLTYFYEPKPNSILKTEKKWLSKPIVNSINADTLNEKFDYSETKNANIYRILTVGDSYTYGQNVDTGNNYSEILENELNDQMKCGNISRFEVINLGVGGYDLEYSVERLYNRGLKYNPDLVIWYIHDWNFDRINELIPSLEEEARKKGIPDFDEKNGYYAAVSYAFSELKKRYGDNYILDYQKKVFDRLNSFYKNRLLIISSLSLNERYKNVIENFISSNANYKYYNGIFDTSSDNKYRLFDGHPNEEGHKRIAESLKKYLLDNYLTQCK